jgi:hypothetical protein
VVIDLYSLAPRVPSGNASTATGALWYTTTNLGDVGTSEFTGCSGNLSGVADDLRRETMAIVRVGLELHPATLA